MNTTKITLTSTILAAALGLALGLPPASALADNVGTGKHRHANKEETTPGYMVTMRLISEPQGSETQGLELACSGETVPQDPGLSADIDVPGCTFPMDLPEAPDFGDVDTLHAYRVEVKKAGKKAPETTLSIYFTTNPMFFPGSAGDIYVSDIIRVMFDPTLNEEGCDIFLFDMAPQPGQLMKVNNPGRGSTAEPSLTFHSICYVLLLTD